MAFLKTLFGNTLETETKEQAVAEQSAKFIETILRKMDEICDVEYSYDPSSGTYTFDIIGGDAGRIIGHKGENLENLRFLTKVFINRELKEEKSPNVIVDIANYTQKRHEAITYQVKEAIRRMERLGKFSILLDYMSAYDRKIAHEVASELGYSSDSIGQGRNRRVKIRNKGE